MAIKIVAAHIASGGKSLLLQTIGQSPQADHEIFDNRPIVLSETRKHGRKSMECNDPKLFFRFA
jgi:hypothetical protein